MQPGYINVCVFRLRLSNVAIIFFAVRQQTKQLQRCTAQAKYEALVGATVRTDTALRVCT